MHPRGMTVVLGVLVWVGSQDAIAQVHELSLEDAVRLATTRGPGGRRLALEERRGLLGERVARRQDWPHLGFDLRAPILEREFRIEPLPSSGVTTIVTPEGDTLEVNRQVLGKTTTSRANASGDLRLQQRLPWRGSLGVTSTLYYRDEETLPAGVRNPRRDYQFGASVDLDLPLLGVDPEGQQRRRGQVERHKTRLRTQAARARLEFATVVRYLALLRAELGLEIVRGAALQAEKAHALASRKVASGLLAEVDGLRMGIHRASRDAELERARAELARSTDAFKIHLGISPGDSLVLTETLAPFEVHTNSDEAVQDALGRRIDVDLMRRDLELLRQEHKTRFSLWPEAGLLLRYGGASSNRILGRALESLSANSLSFLLTLRMPLWDAGRRRLEQEEEGVTIDLGELEIEELQARIQLEVQDAVRTMFEALRRYELYSASVRLAEESLQIMGQRYERGLVDTSAYLSAQNDVASAHLGRTAALLDLHAARARLRLLTMTGES